MTTETLVHRYVPRGAAAEVMRRRESEVLVAGPAGTGKSRACLEKLHSMMLLTPGAKGLIVRKTQRSLASTALATFEKFVAVEALNVGIVKYFGGSDRIPPQYRYENGSSISLGGMDNPTKVMSSEYDVIYVQEATELNVTDWEALTTRLRNWTISFQQLLADCNPDRDTHWLNKRCNDGKTVMLHSRHRDNPELYDDDGSVTERGAAYMATLDALTGVRRLRLRDGIWAAAEGLVYEGWDPAVHVVDRFEPPASWPRVWSIDFGFTNPFVCQCWVTDPDGRLILEWEVYHTRRTVEQHCADIAAHCLADPRFVVDTAGRGGTWHGEWKVPRPQGVICDHDAEGRATLQQHLGLPTRPAYKRVSGGQGRPPGGIQAVETRLEVAGDGRPRVMLMRDAVLERDPALLLAALPACTEEEWPGYVWAQLPGKAPKEEPVKENDHGMDATRYRVADADLGVRPRIRRL